MKHIGAALLFVLDAFAAVLMGLLFGLVFVGAQIASWTKAEE